MVMCLLPPLLLPLMAKDRISAAFVGRPLTIKRRLEWGCQCSHVFHAACREPWRHLPEGRLRPRHHCPYRCERTAAIAALVGEEAQDADVDAEDVAAHVDGEAVDADVEPVDEDDDRELFS